MGNPDACATAEAGVSAKRLGFGGQFAHAKLKLAGELRALSASASAAQIELDLNRLWLLDVNVLAEA